MEANKKDKETPKVDKKALEKSIKEKGKVKENDNIVRK